MTAPLLYALPENEAITAALAEALGCEIGRIDTRQFPDGESYLKYLTPPQGRPIALVCTLAHPNDKFLPLIFAASTARDLGATKVGLIAPYLAYMRQDRRFNPGEAVTSLYVARLLSNALNWLVTIDPHLHRYHSLAEIYGIPARAVHAAPLISRWIREHTSNAIVIGPDGESEQWVSAVADQAGIPYTVLDKIRHGDREVEVRPKHPERLEGRQPILVDDIISSGRTMLEAVRQLQSPVKPICIAIHGIFADNSDRLLVEAGATVVTCNTIPHASNAINVSPILATAAAEFL